MAHHLPFDLLCKEVFPRLPAKSIGRFMCLSKSWHSVLKNSEFATEQLHHATKKLLVISENESPNFPTTRFHTLDYEAKTDHGAVSKLDFPLGDDVYAMVVGSCNGIICVGILSPRPPGSESFELPLLLWNPLTGDYKKIPCLCPYSICCKAEAWGLCYDESVKDFKIVCVDSDGYGNIFTLKSNSWKKLTERVEGCSMYEPGVFINGKLYWGIYEHNLPSRKIVCFDSKNEKFTRMSLPLVRNPCSILYLDVYQDCLHVFVPYGEGKQYLEVWRMNERKEQVWERTPAMISPAGNWDFTRQIPVCFTSNGEVIVFQLPIQDKDIHNEIFKYSFENRRIEHNFKIIDSIREDLDEKPYIGTLITYLETLVSPNDIG